MKISSRFLVCAGVLGTLAWPSQALIYRDYPGLNALIKEADTVAIISVAKVPVERLNEDWNVPDCYVIRTLKDNLKLGRLLKIGLNETFCANRGYSGEAVTRDTTHLVFLHRLDEPFYGANYAILNCEGADYSMAPFVSKTKPAGKTLKTQIQTLIRNYKIYRNKQIKIEDQQLNKALAE